jgi:hypothetical protein
MRSILACSLLTTMLLAGGAHGASQGAGPASSAVQSAQGFGAMLVITAQSDWQAQWDGSTDAFPDFPPASEVSLGGKLHILTFLTNPQLGLGNRADVRCDLQVLRPDGSFSVNQRDIVCYDGLIGSKPGQVYLAAPTMTFLAEPTDLRGEWTVRVFLRDRPRGVELPLEAKFTFED